MSDYLPNGIAHGPYQNLPIDMLDVYLSDPERYGAPIDMTLEQFIADRESEWQYDQHSQAVVEASQTRRISPAVESYFLKIVLRSWWIGGRRPGEYESVF